MKEKIEQILKKNLPEKAFVMLHERPNIFGKGTYLMIGFAASNHLINGISFQYPQFCSLSLDLTTMELEPQIYGGSGGNKIYRNPDLTHHKEKYLAMVGVKIPFRKPQPNEKAILRAIELFTQRWVQALKDNREVLRYQDIVDYDDLLA